MGNNLRLAGPSSTDLNLEVAYFKLLSTVSFLDNSPVRWYGVLPYILYNRLFVGAVSGFFTDQLVKRNVAR